MICTHLILDSNSVSVAIPDNYIGIQVEVIVFADDDIQQTPVEREKCVNMKRYCLKKEL